MSIIPAIIPTSLEELFRVAKSVSSFARALQIDVTDGVFVQSTCWPYSEGKPEALGDALLALSEEFPHLVLEIDAMVRNPEKYIESWMASGAERIVIHIESTEHLDAIVAIPRNGVTLGLALGNDTPLEALDPYVSRIDFVQFMGIATIGIQGEPFDERVIGRISGFHEKYPDLPLSVDGSINEHTVLRVRDAGVSRCVVGSAILKAENPEHAYEHLLRLSLQH
jgi:ribulose-phosphate 3-epimerase